MSAPTMPVWVEADLIVRRAQRRIAWRERAAVATLWAGVAVLSILLGVTVGLIVWGLFR